jgi:mRNA-degrading endonuclease RelE of RelBE toxin-antitoxin system
MAYGMDVMVFKETTVFTRQIGKLISDEAYREFQQELIFNPTAGDLIKGSGGLRKIRWRSATGGKRGGIRVIYYWYVADSEIFLLLAYGKKEKTDLSAKEVKILRTLVEENM